MKIKIFFLVSILFLLIGCHDKEKEAELTNKIKELETQLDDCKNGAEKLSARMKLSFERKDYDDCKNIYHEMEKRHPDSELFSDVKKIYEKVINIENKKAEELRLRKERERKEKLRSLNKLKKRYDDVSGITWYEQPYFVHYNNLFRTSIYIGQNNSQIWLRLKMSYQGDNWIFFNAAFLSYEGNTREIYFDEYKEKKTDNGYSGVWEWIDVSVPDDLIPFLREFATSKRAKMRFSGKYTRTRTLSAKERQGIIDVLNGYDALKESLQ